MRHDLPNPSPKPFSRIKRKRSRHEASALYVEERCPWVQPTTRCDRCGVVVLGRQYADHLAKRCEKRRRAG